jgi:adenylate cyclase class 2
MTTETEVKIEVDRGDLPEIRRRLLELGFQQKAERAKEENLLMDFVDGALTASGSALRLRKYGQKQVLTYKGPRVEDSHLKIREEIETELGDFDQMKRVLEALGMKVCFEYGKFREKFLYGKASGSLEVCVDETPVGCFVEIEGSAADIQRVAGDLGWNRDRFITKNYIDLYRERNE